MAFYQPNSSTAQHTQRWSFGLQLATFAAHERECHKPCTWTRWTKHPCFSTTPTPGCIASEHVPPNTAIRLQHTAGQRCSPYFLLILRNGPCAHPNKPRCERLPLQRHLMGKRIGILVSANVRWRADFRQMAQLREREFRNTPWSSSLTSPKFFDPLVSCLNSPSHNINLVLVLPEYQNWLFHTLTFPARSWV